MERVRWSRSLDRMWWFQRWHHLPSLVYMDPHLSTSGVASVIYFLSTVQRVQLLIWWNWVSGEVEVLPAVRTQVLWALGRGAWDEKEWRANSPHESILMCCSGACKKLQAHIQPENKLSIHTINIINIIDHLSIYFLSIYHFSDQGETRAPHLSPRQPPVQAKEAVNAITM